MIIKCKIIETIFDNNEIKNVKVYGFIVYPFTGDKIIRAIENIFTDKSITDALCDLINNNDLDEVHVDDVIEDTLCA